MSLYIPLVVESVPLILSAASIVASIFMLSTRILSEKKIKRKIQKSFSSNKTKNRIYKIYIEGKSKDEDSDLRKIEADIESILKRSDSFSEIEKKMLFRALHQSSYKGRKNYISNLIESVNKDDK